ncbi:MAG: tripartite tricarboxylate transporter substrate binding protein [Betaproteobacteria bacterium]|nr:tripartite tricarboxylate transporter substrate binding protein [Betaproteobacteria bacterium]
MKRIAIAAIACLAIGAHAQTTTQAIVPFPPGGALDALARMMTQTVGEQTKESFVVENRAGANGLIGAKAVAGGKPDGRMWLFADASTMTVNPALYPKDPAFDAHRDLRAVLALGFMPSLLTAHPALGPKTLDEFIELARRQEIPYVSGGIGATGHLSMEYLDSVTGGLRLRHVPYKGGAPAMTDHIAGQVPAGFGVYAGALPQVRAGKLIALAVSGKQRSAQLPSVPTVSESGYPGFEVEVGYFVMVQGKTPDALTREIEAKLRRALSESSVQERIRVLGIEPAPGMSSAEAARWIAAEHDKWARLIRDKGIRAE